MKTLTTTRHHLYYTLFHPKFYACVIMILAAVYTRVQPYLLIANDFNENVNIGVLSFVFSDGFCTTIIYAALLLIFSDLPFSNPQQIMLLTRSGKRAWCGSQILYIAVISIFVTLISVLFGALILAGNLSFDDAWGRIIVSVKNNNLPTEYLPPDSVKLSGILNFTPYSACCWSMLVMTFCSIVFGCIVMSLNMLSNSSAGVITGGLLIALHLFGGYFLDSFLAYISPLDWANIGKIDTKHIGGFPVPEYAVTTLAILLALSVGLVFIQSKKGSDILRR